MRNSGGIQGDMVGHDRTWPKCKKKLNPLHRKSRYVVISSKLSTETTSRMVLVTCIISSRGIMIPGLELIIFVVPILIPELESIPESYFHHGHNSDSGSDSSKKRNHNTSNIKNSSV